MSFDFITQAVKAVAISFNYSEGCLHLMDSISLEPTANNPHLFMARVQLTFQHYRNGKRFPICIG